MFFIKWVVFITPPSFWAKPEGSWRHSRKFPTFLRRVDCGATPNCGISSKGNNWRRQTFQDFWKNCVFSNPISSVWACVCGFARVLACFIPSIIPYSPTFFLLTGVISASLEWRTKCICTSVVCEYLHFGIMLRGAYAKYVSARTWVCARASVFHSFHRSLPPPLSPPCPVLPLSFIYFAHIQGYSSIYFICLKLIPTVLSGSISLFLFSN